jgi:hypothetical protein
MLTTFEFADHEIRLIGDALTGIALRGRRDDVIELALNHPCLGLFSLAVEPVAEDA